MTQQPQAERGSEPALRIPEEQQGSLATTREPLVVSRSPSDKRSAIGTPAIGSEHAKFSDEVHNYVREHIRNADQKATFFFAVLTAILAFLNAQAVPARWLKDVRLWSIVDALGFISMLGLTAGTVVLLLVIFPRLKGSRRGLLFFNAVAEYEDSSEFTNDVLALSADNLVRAKLQHCFELSKICRSKYRALRVGFWLGSIGAASAVLFLFFAKTGTS